MTINELQVRVEELHSRASLGVPGIPWSDVAETSLKVRAASTYLAASTVGVGIDGWITAAEDDWPPEVLAAVERLELLDRYDPQTLAGTFQWLGEAQRNGLLSSWKGTLFENQVADLVEASELDLADEPHTLELARRLNQPGWDAEVIADGEVIERVQMKATDDPDRILDHLERYPDVPTVVTTSEGAEAAAARGIHVVESGISNADMERTLTAATDSLDPASAVHEVLPGVGLAVLVAAAGARVRRGDDPATVWKWLSAEAGVLTAAHGVGLATELATGVVVIRPAAAVATRLMLRRAQSQTAARGRSAELGERVAKLKVLAVARNRPPVPRPRSQSDLPDALT